MAKTINLKVEADTSSAEKNLEDVGKQAENAADKASQIGDASKESTKSVGLLSKGFKGLGTAIKAAGIGLVIGLVAKLTEVFGENQKVIDATSKAFNTLSIVFTQFTKPIIDVADAIFSTTENFDALLTVGKSVLTIVLTPIRLALKNIEGAFVAVQLAWESSFLGSSDNARIEELQNDLKQVGQDILDIGNDAIEAGGAIVNNIGEAFTEAGEIFTKTKDAIVEGYNEIDVASANAAASQLQNARKQAEFDEAAQQRLIEQYDLQAERLRQIRDDESLSIEERIAANEQLGEVLTRQIESEQRLVNSRIANLQRENELLGETQERSLEIFNLQTELEAINARVEGQRSEQLVNRNALLKEQRELLNEINAIGATDEERELLEAEQELLRQQELINRTVENEELKNERLLAAQQAYQDEVLRITTDSLNKEQEQRIKAAQAEAQLLQAQQDARISNLNTVAQAVTAVSQLIGENAGQQKGIAIAQAIIDTYAGAAKAIGQGGIFGAVQAAGVIAAGLANVRRIEQTEIPNVSSTPSVSTGGLGSTPSVDLSNAFSSDNPQLVEITNTTDNTVQAYVLEGDVTSQQEAAARVRRRSEL
ncbi:MAG: hypothetical protein HRU12_10585 [Phaeodactylibacter sp.]|nr:hypothetical protein [Phaeodactylibacter sp.]